MKSADNGKSPSSSWSAAPVALLICGIASIAYGALVLSLRSGTWFFAFWLVVGALLLAASWAVRTGRWNSLSILARRGIGIAVGILLAGFAITQACILSEFDDHGEDGLDCIVVLGAQVREDGPSPVLKYRLDTARDYLERNPETRCIVSGGQGTNELKAEADGMAEYLVSCGIDSGRITIENRSSNTKENMDFSAALLDPAHDRIGIVTNNFHLFRSLALARKAGCANICGIAAPSSLGMMPNNLTRESFSIAKDFLEDNMQI